MIFRILRVLVLLLIAFFICGLKSESRPPIKIGVTLTLSGFAAIWGTNARQGIELALDEINQNDGINGSPLKVLYEDFGNVDLKAVASGTAKLTEVDKVSVMLTQWSEDTEVVWPIAARKNVITLSISAGAQGITKKSPLLFRVSSSDEKLVKTAIEHIIGEGKTKLGILAEQTAYFDSISKIAEEYWKHRTGNDPYMLSYPPETTDFRMLIARLRARGCDAVFLYTLHDSQALVLKQLSELRYHPLKIGPPASDDPNVLEVAKTAAEGLRFVKYKSASPGFISKFEARYDKEPKIPAEYAYDAIMLLTKVMRENGTSTQDIQKGLLGVKDYPGASGSITIDDYGDRLSKEVEIREIKNGKSRLWNAR